MNNAIAAAKNGVMPSKKIMIQISDDEGGNDEDMGGEGEEDNWNDGNTKNTKTQYMAGLIPAAHYKPTLAQELRDKQIKKMQKRKGHNIHSVTGLFEEDKDEKEINTSKPRDKETRSGSVPGRSTAGNTKSTKMGLNIREPPASQQK